MRSHPRFSLRFLCVLCVSAVSPFPAAFAQPGKLLGPAQQSRMQDSNLKPALPGALVDVGIDQRLDQQVSLDLTFKDEAGRDVPLSSVFKRGKPVILAPVYYRCPMLCTQILNGLASSLKAVSLDPGKDFEIVAVSFDKKEAYAMLVEVPAGLPADKSPTRHADYRFLGKPDQGMQDLLMEQLKKDPNWY